MTANAGKPSNANREIDPAIGFFCGAFVGLNTIAALIYFLRGRRRVAFQALVLPLLFWPINIAGAWGVYSGLVWFAQPGVGSGFFIVIFPTAFFMMFIAAWLARRIVCAISWPAPQAVVDPLTRDLKEIPDTLTVNLKNRWIVVGVLIVAVFGAASYILRLGVFSGTADGYAVGDTGIRQSGIMNFSWCDNEHVVVARDRTDIPDRDELIYLDIRNPTAIRPIDLGNPKEDEPNTIARISGLTCHDNDILFSGRTLAPREGLDSPRRIYHARPDRPAELLVALKEERSGTNPVSLKHKYVVGNGNLSSSQPPGSITPDCADYVASGYKLLCWETLHSNVWPLEKFILAIYRWDDSFILQDSSGKKKHARNPTPPLIGENDKPVTYALFLRDFEGKVLKQLDKDPNFAEFTNLVVDKNEGHVYATCRRLSEPPNKRNSICRYVFDTNTRNWEELFVFEPNDKSFITIEGFSALSDEGDLAFTAGWGHPGIWIYDAKKHIYTRITSSRDDTRPQMSANGLSILFLRREQGVYKLTIGQRREH